VNLEPRKYILSPEIQRAQRMGKPIVALESTVITHGLPHPQNLALARDMEAEIAGRGAVAATIALLSGKIHVGLDAAQHEQLAGAAAPRKVSTRDLASAIIKGEHGGTTVAATLHIAHLAGISVFATGGIGGVHHEPPFDVSADLTQLARTPLVLVCAGAKAILDLPATLETLETLAVPVVGWQTDEFPAFYTVSSSLPVSIRLDTADEVYRFARAHWEMGMQSAVLVVAPPPAETAMPAAEVNRAVEQALAEARAQGVRGQAVSPFLLARVSELTDHASLEANLSLLKNNARVAAEIAVAFSQRDRRRVGYV
jgi:pseudouridine-5'-phosphate glycosidase